MTHSLQSPSSYYHLSGLGLRNIFNKFLLKIKNVSWKVNYVVAFKETWVIPQLPCINLSPLVKDSILESQFNFLPSRKNLSTSVDLLFIFPCFRESFGVCILHANVVFAKLTLELFFFPFHPGCGAHWSSGTPESTNCPGPCPRHGVDCWTWDLLHWSPPRSGSSWSHSGLLHQQRSPCTFPRFWRGE